MSKDNNLKTIGFGVDYPEESLWVTTSQLDFDRVYILPFNNDIKSVSLQLYYIILNSDYCNCYILNSR
jgi:hypothetical protein